jgi:hypothetical protein
MARERTTWNRDEVAKRASLSKRADPYLMNQDHVKQQPSADEYAIGGPSDFAEDIHPSTNTWEAEYANGQVKRNEIGMPEMRSDTFTHAEKTASEVEMVKKASLAVAVARAMLSKKATSSMVEEQASRLMRFADEDLVETYKALVANEDEQEEEETQDKQAQQQDQFEEDAQEKQAGELPPALKKFNEEKAEKAEDKEQDKKAQDQQQGQGQQDQAKQAQMDMQGQMQQMMAQMQQMMAQLQGQQAGQQQSQQVMAQGQQQGQQQGQSTQACMQQPMADQQLVDDMLFQQDPQMSDMDIEMDVPSMDTGDVMMNQDDDILNQIFANAETDQAQQAQQAQQGQQKQAHAVRTASTRTVGTRPSQGVSGLGGLSAASNGGSDLSSIWTSAPDVRDAFGINR